MIKTTAYFLAFLRLFYQNAGWRLPALLLLIAVGGLIEAVGIATLLPLLNIAVGETVDNRMARAVVNALGGVGIAPSVLNLLLVIVFIFSVRAVLVFHSAHFDRIVENIRAGRSILPRPRLAAQ